MNIFIGTELEHLPSDNCTCEECTHYFKRKSNERLWCGTCNTSLVKRSLNSYTFGSTCAGTSVQESILSTFGFNWTKVNGRYGGKHPHKASDFLDFIPYTHDHYLISGPNGGSVEGCCVGCLMGMLWSEDPSPPVFFDISLVK